MAVRGSPLFSSACNFYFFFCQDKCPEISGHFFDTICAAMSIAFEKLLNELLQDCDPLCYLNIQPAKFPLVVATNCNRFTCRGYAFQIINRQKFLMHRLARNSAIASGNLARIFSQAFFPSPGASVAGNHIGDPGLYSTEHLLRLSTNLASFGDAMVEIALTVDETARHEQTRGRATQPPRLPDSSST